MSAVRKEWKKTSAQEFEISQSKIAGYNYTFYWLIKKAYIEIIHGALPIKSLLREETTSKKNT